MIEDLKNKKAALELLQNETNDKLNDYKQQISILQKQIDDLVKQRDEAQAQILIFEQMLADAKQQENDQAKELED